MTSNVEVVAQELKLLVAEEEEIAEAIEVSQGKIISAYEEIKKA